jgi:hypothetical protein
MLSSVTKQAGDTINIEIMRALALSQSSNRTWIGSVQGAIATWSNYGVKC